MLVETHFPRRLSPSRYDSFLASGWFRGSLMLYKMDLLCVDEELFSVVNIRINLLTHQPSKSQRKLMRRNDKLFQVVVAPVTVNAEKERLYHLQKPRFKGFIHNTLEEYLAHGMAESIFDTRELQVYDQGELVAVSYFDVGGHSQASLLGLNDPSYARYSLGTYTLLKEMEFGITEGRKWFYPGYVLDRPSAFDYKLKLGQIEFYTPTKRWAKWSRFHREMTSTWRIEYALNNLSNALKELEVPHNDWLYPYFTLGNLPFVKIEFLHLPRFIEIGYDLDGTLVLGYSPLSGGYVVAHILPCPNEFPHSIMEFAGEYDNAAVYWSALMKIGDVRYANASLDEVMDYVEAWRKRLDSIACFEP